MSLFKLRELKVKLERSERPMDLVYEWTKTSHVTKAEFVDLITYVTEVLKA